MDVTTLAELLHETAEHHDQYEKTHAAAHNWWDWYAAFAQHLRRRPRLAWEPSGRCCSNGPP